jgi:hypothetical protein
MYDQDICRTVTRLLACNNCVVYLMLSIFCAVNYYADLLIKPSTAQVHLYTV